jgi:hypothetical protein
VKHIGKIFKNSFGFAHIFLLFFLSSTAFLGAQKISLATREIRGLVVEDTLGIPDVHVLNLSTIKSTITDAEGFFRISVHYGDTLYFSAIRYRKTSLVITQEVLEASSVLIPLTPYVNELDEVVVTPYNLSGRLDADVERLPPVNPVSAFSLGLPNAAAKRLTQTENRLYEATTGGGIVPLNPIINAITGRTKYLKKQLALERRYALSVNMRAKFPDSLFVNRLGILLERIPDFMYYCEVDAVFQETANSNDALLIWEFLETKSKEYLNNNKLAN